MLKGPGVRGWHFLSPAVCHLMRCQVTKFTLQLLRLLVVAGPKDWNSDFSHRTKGDQRQRCQKPAKNMPQGPPWATYARSYAISLAMLQAMLQAMQSVNVTGWPQDTQFSSCKFATCRRAALDVLLIVFRVEGLGTCFTLVSPFLRLV